MDDPVERTLIRALAMFCAALTALAFLALTQSCRSSMHSAECIVHNDTARVESSRSWQRVVESVASWEADSIVVGPQTPAAGACRADGDTPIAAPRVVIYRPRATAQSSLAESSTDTISASTATRTESSTETTRSTTRPLWPCLAVAAIAYVAIVAGKKILRFFRYNQGS